jgi:hypothetical protein
MNMPLQLTDEELRTLLALLSRSPTGGGASFWPRLPANWRTARTAGQARLSASRRRSKNAARAAPGTIAHADQRAVNFPPGGKFQQTNERQTDRRGLGARQAGR